MIEPLVDLIRTEVLAPQAADTTPADRRLYPDPDRAPLDVSLQTADVAPVSSTPVAAEIGAPGEVGRMTLEHVLMLVVAIQSDTRGDAEHRRDPIVTDLMRRAARLDWTNALPPDSDHEVSSATWIVDYTDLEAEQHAAWATLTFTIRTEWTL